MSAAPATRPDTVVAVANLIRWLEAGTARTTCSRRISRTAILSGRVRLHPTGDGLWLVGPEGAAVPMRALRGHSYLRELLRRPGRAISALVLVGGGSGVVVQAGVGDVLDRQALQAYRERLGELELDLAEEWSDVGRLEALHAEHDALVDELAAATGLGGRPRSGGSSHERARVAVTKAITAAIQRIATLNAPIGAHLRTAIQTGTQCSYQPAVGDERDWILD